MYVHLPPNASSHASRGPLSAALLALPDYVFTQVIAHNMRAGAESGPVHAALKSRAIRAVILLIHRRRPYAEG